VENCNASAVTILKDKGKQKPLLFLENLCLRADQITLMTSTKTSEQSHSKFISCKEKSSPIQKNNSSQANKAINAEMSG